MSQDAEALAATVRDVLIEFSGDAIARGRHREGIFGRRETALSALDSLLALLRERTEERDVAKTWVAELAGRERDALKARVEALEEALRQIDAARSHSPIWDASTHRVIARSALKTTPTDMPSDKEVRT